ncbi:MAG: HAD hydrolase family protein [Phycisphaerales bacterium]|jgi:3-deoxy-D-manno-octulosonate 8-phosphate phosphatase (KDO 8-P phosphatase)|nr:HAD hydrolase family protein [Phycisphaerales bacterium]
MSVPTNITVLALDVDGVLTDGTIGFAQLTGAEMKQFHVHDGLGISLWLRAGNEVIFISGRKADCVTIRAKELGVNYVCQGSKDKIADLDAFLTKIGASKEQTAFVGDDLGDIPVMQHVGFAVAVHDATQEVKEIAHFVTSKDGGNGAVRETIELLMKAQGSWQEAINSLTTTAASQ